MFRFACMIRGTRNGTKGRSLGGIQTNDTSDSWRETLLDRIRYAFLGVWFFGAFMATFWTRSRGVLVLSIVMMLVIPLIHFSLAPGRFPYLFRARLAIGCLTMASIAGYFLVGLNPGPIAVAAFAVVVAALLLGRRETTWLLALFVAPPLGIAAAIWAGVWAGPNPAESNVSDPAIWLRSTALSTISLVGIAYSVFFVVNTVEGMLQRRTQALKRLKDEESLRRAAERAQRDAETIANQAQRLESVGRLGAGVAHDFNNALLVIQGWNDLIRRSDSDQELRSQGAEAIHQASAQAAQLAQQLLAFGRKAAHHPTYLLADRLIKACTQTLSRLLPSNMSIQVTTQPDAAIFADEMQMQQVMFNLILNASDALPHGGEIQVRNWRCPVGEIPTPFPGMDAHDDWVVVSVEDQGIGMDEDTQRKAFDPFFTTKPLGEGNGLGLSTVFGIVRQSGGHIDLWSEVGRGTRFTIYLPAVQVAPANLERISDTEPKTVSNNRVLVIEDDPLARELIVFALTREGIEVGQATDGSEALRVMQDSAELIDVLCTDAVFPGAPLSEVISAFEATSPEGKVLICSGYIPENLPNQGIETGAYEFLPKPFSAKQLVSKIGNMLPV